MILAEFEDLLQRTMGLDAASVGSPVIERAVQQRQDACALPDVSAYWEHVRTSAAELQELIEGVVVPETWFYRDPEAFAALGRLVFEDWLHTHADGVLRLLSLPCSTGEEPYSMAMTLLDAGFPADRFRIDAVDISARALAQARRAVYGKNSFRGGSLEFRDRHFTAQAHGWRLAEAVRRQVHFQQGNLCDDALLPDPAVYDIIFCRNVLIYFDRTTQDRAIALLTRLLTAKGCCFVGPSETGLLMNHAFASAQVPLAFAFRKSGAVSREPPHPAVRPARLAPSARPAAASAFPPRRRPPAPAAAPPPAEMEPDLDETVRLADQGRLAEAARQCEEHLRSHGPSARAFYLLALVRDATGQDAEASAFYRKAIYLDPHHHEALVHLACLLEKQGDTAGAKVLQIRARRELTDVRT
jgi:chemotaxis protein methyltransferase WspC